MKKQMINENLDDLYIELDYLKNDYNLALSTIQDQKEDIKRFLLLLIERDIPIPEDLINRYINKAPTFKKQDDDELPF